MFFASLQLATKRFRPCMNVELLQNEIKSVLLNVLWAIANGHPF